MFRPEIFDELQRDEDLVEGPVARLARRGKVLAYPYEGYWCPADTVKERAQLEELYERGNCPWMIWDPERSGGAEAPVEVLTYAVDGAKRAVEAPVIGTR